MPTNYRIRVPASTPVENSQLDMASAQEAEEAVLDAHIPIFDPLTQGVSAGGYKEVDERDLRDAKRREQEEKAQTEKRKAERIRCSSCKRFKCVC